jgi:8-oxo-dGTP diphosphatase
MEQKRAVCLLMVRPDGKILAVSRKDDPSKFGLPGGKVEEGENGRVALAREVFEETGLHVSSHKDELRSPFTAMCNDYACTTYSTDYRDFVFFTEEEGVPMWVSKDVLFDGPFAEYNRFLFRSLKIS